MEPHSSHEENEIMAIGLTNGNSYPLSWKNGTQIIQTTIEQVADKEIKCPGLVLRDGALSIL